MNSVGEALRGVWARHPANFRDLGGVVAGDGRLVRSGLVYRSCAPSKLPSATRRSLQNIGIRTRVDLRSERQHLRDAGPALPGCRSVHLPIVVESLSVSGIWKHAMAGTLTAELAMQEATAAYRETIERFTPTLARWLELLAEPESLPALVHCSAGKDRTGMAVALLLLALGVPQDAVERDYMVTNEFTRRERARIALFVAGATRGRTRPADISPLLRVELAYLRSAMAVIDEQFGGFARYRRDELGLNDAALAALQDRLLT